MDNYTIKERLGAEFLGTFWLVFGGCGAAVLASSFAPATNGAQLGIGFVGVAIAFGLTVLTMAYAVGHISGGHFNPAVTVGLATGRRFPWRDVVPYVVTQVVAGMAAAAVLLLVANGIDGFSASKTGFATNGYGDRSPGGYGLLSVLLIEVVTTAMFLFVILGTTDTRAPRGFAPLGIGLCLTLIHLVSIPVSNTSVNPARSTGPALFAGSGPLGQLWAFWLAPLVGGALAGLAYTSVFARRAEPSPLEVATEA